MAERRTLDLRQTSLYSLAPNGEPTFDREHRDSESPRLAELYRPGSRGMPNGSWNVMNE
jgi:hypothetical protein